MLDYIYVQTFVVSVFIFLSVLTVLLIQPILQKYCFLLEGTYFSEKFGQSLAFSLKVLFFSNSKVETLPFERKLNDKNFFEFVIFVTNISGCLLGLGSHGKVIDIKKGS